MYTVKLDLKLQAQKSVIRDAPLLCTLATQIIFHFERVKEVINEEG